ncbi:hypothetical protein KPSA3_01164 [Pseudomonas syringae pv. actinidiae]|uniref:Uncharacterized protein n=1 Tax=Pseudomonas syringae pv. actinidiae TaxID=103796 RepID=A0AAN4TJC7_PSESF|nr:hypothetical protein KPSA3_01164 [Pseudomonas syringae pv. actinidiae]
MQVGQRQGQRTFNARIGFAGDALGQQIQLRRAGAFLQLQGGCKTQPGVGCQQLVAGQRGIDQAAQPVVQAQFARFIRGWSVVSRSRSRRRIRIHCHVFVVVFDPRALAAVSGNTAIA